MGHVVKETHCAVILNLKCVEQDIFHLVLEWFVFILTKVQDFILNPLKYHFVNLDISFHLAEIFLNINSLIRLIN